MLSGETILKIGFIGLGNMGSAAARNVQRAGHSLVVYDINPDAAKKFIEEGAQWAASPAAVIDAVDIVFTMVFGPKEVGINVSTINFCLKALVEKGWIKMGNFSKNPDKLSYAYLLTPTGVAEKAVLTRRFLQRKMAEYEKLRGEIEALQLEEERSTSAVQHKS